MTIGDPSGLEAVYLAHRDQLVRFLVAQGAGDAAEDLLQEIWLKVRATPPTGPLGAPLAYLYRIASNLMIDRHRATRQAATRETAWSESIEPASAGGSGEPPADRRLVAREELGVVEKALEEAGPRASAIFRRHRIDGLSQREVAREMRLGLTTIESELRKAYRLLIEARTRLDEA